MAYSTDGLIGILFSHVNQSRLFPFAVSVSRVFGCRLYTAHEFTVYTHGNSGYDCGFVIPNSH